jgi:hypothetical protein
MILAAPRVSPRSSLQHSATNNAALSTVHIVEPKKLSHAALDFVSRIQRARVLRRIRCRYDKDLLREGDLHWWNREWVEMSLGPLSLAEGVLVSLQE